MRIYGALLSPFVRKVCVIAAEKGVDYELAVTSPGGDNAEFMRASPFGKIPAMVDGDFELCDSSAIAAYIEARDPDPALLPADPRARGRAVWFDEFADTVLAASVIKVLFNRLVGPKLLKLPHDENVALQGEAELPRILDYLESVAPADGWLAGEAFSMGDIAVASVLRSGGYVGWGPDASRYPQTAAWYARVAARPAWQKVAAEEDKPRR